MSVLVYNCSRKVRCLQLLLKNNIKFFLKSGGNFLPRFLHTIAKQKQVMTEQSHYAKGSEKPILPDDGKLRLYSMRFCPFAQRAHLILNAKNIPYHVININLNEKPEWYLEVNSSGKVPALHLVNEPGSPFLSESLIITEYLDEKYPQNPVYPKDPINKALDKLWIEKFSPIIGAVVRILLGEENSEKALNDITQTLSQFESELKKRDSSFFGGEKPGILDYAIWPWFERLAAINSVVGDTFSLKADTYPHLVKWRDLLMNDPAVQKHYLSPEDHSKFFESKRSGTPNFNLLVKNE